MREKRVFFARTKAVRLRIAEWIVNDCPEGWSVTAMEPVRNMEQNARFHAMCGDLAKCAIEWAGRRRTTAQWKVLLISGHAVLTKEGSEMIPGLEGEFVNIRESSAQMSVKRTSSLIDYTRHFGDSQGVKWTEPIEVEHE